jgi:hypothetical protein
MTESLGVQLDATIAKGSRDAAYEWKDNVDAGVPWEQWNPEQQAKAVEDKYALDNHMEVKFGGHVLTPAEPTNYNVKLTLYSEGEKPVGCFSALPIRHEERRVSLDPSPRLASSWPPQREQRPEAQGFACSAAWGAACSRSSRERPVASTVSRSWVTLKA